VTAIYEPFTAQGVSDKIAEMLSSRNQREVKIIFQTVEDLHIACPKNLGIGTLGDYPPGGNRVVNRAFMNFMRVKMRERIKIN
jgi:amidophosphoribosyltransferase